jgi:TolB protein
VFERDDGEDAPDPTVAMAGDGAALVFDTNGIVRRLVRGRPVRVVRFQTTGFATAGGKVVLARQTFPGGCACNATPRWSPDGGRLVFSSGYENSDLPGIYTMAASGGSPTRLADGVQPLWSPDGSKIVAEQTVPSASLVIVDSSGGNLHRIDNALDPAWSPDGSKVAFTRPRNASDDVVVVNAAGSGAHGLASDARLPDWSPDGTRLAVVGRTGIDVIGADGSNRRTVVARFGKPSWSPDGSRLLLPEGDGLHMVSADGAVDIQVTRPDYDHGENDFAASWSPSGSEIAFVRSHYDYDADIERDRRVWIASADGSGERPLTTQIQFVEEPAWSPSGGRIAFVSGGELYVADTEGTGLTRITMTGPAEPRSTGAVFSGSNKKLASFGFTGNLHAIALSPRVAAVLVRGFSGTRIELFDPVTGSSRGGVDVDDATDSELSAAGQRIVFHQGSRIMLLDAATKKITLVATAAGKPIGLSIEGRRIAWAENLGTKARIRAVTAP